MSKMGKDLRSFFQPSSSQASASTPAESAATARGKPDEKPRPSPRNHASSSLQFSSLPSSPQTPQKSDAVASARRDKTAPLMRDDEIKGSDEDSDDLDGDDSDSSVESISAIFGLSKPSPKYERPAAAAQRDAMTTPQAKRVASIGGGGHKSPLTLQQRLRRGGVTGAGQLGGRVTSRTTTSTRHKFDMKALLQHTRENERVEASARRAQELIDMPDVDDNDGENSGSDSDTKGANKSSSNLREKARVVLQGGGGGGVGGGGGDGEDDAGEKLARAIDRTKSKPTRRCCYFFSPGVSPAALKAKTKRMPFPLAAATGRWEFLADPTTRAQSVVHQIPQSLIMRGIKMPKALLTWFIGELCVESNAQTRLRYADIIACSGERAGRLLSTKRLYTILEPLGGPRERGPDEKLSSAMEREEAYAKRDWGPLTTYLRTLARMAPHLKKPEDAVLLLLQMGLDPVCGTIARHEHAVAMEALVGCLPDESMLQFTSNICAFITRCVTDTVLQTQAVNSIPKTTPRLRNLWRGVTQGIIFGQTAISATAAAKNEDALTLEMILERLEKPDFVVSQTTDFEEFRSLVMLLDGAIGNAAFLRPPWQEHPESEQPSTQQATSPTTITVSILSPKQKLLFPPAPNSARATSLSAPKTQANAHHQFDAKVDTLTRRIELIANKIHDSNSPERKEAKTALDALAKRLAYSVRMRPPAKTSIFDMAGLRGAGASLARKMRAAEEEKVEVPRQRDFMKSWAGGGGGGGEGASYTGSEMGRLNAVLVDGETGLSHGVS